MPHACLGYVQTRFLSITAVVADAMAKAAGVRILGLEPTGMEEILIRVAAASPGDVQAALDVAQATASALGSSADAVLLANPREELARLNAGPLLINALYGGREEMRPEDYNQNLRKIMTTTSQQALGILETQGLTAILEATDTMLKAANVTLVGKEKIGAAYVTIIIRGDVAAVKAAVEAGEKAAAAVGKVIAAHVIARPHADLAALLPSSSAA